MPDPFGSLQVRLLTHKEIHQWIWKDILEQNVTVT